MSKPPIIPPGQTLPPMDTDTEGKRSTTRADDRSARRRKHAERFAVLNTFVDCSMADLSRAEALAWLVLYRDTRNGTARTSHADIARRIGSDPRTARRAVRRLIDRGLLRLVYRGGLNRGPSRYRVIPLADTPKAKLSSRSASSRQSRAPPSA